MQPAVTIPPSGNERKTYMNPLNFAAYLAAVVALFVADVLTPRGATPSDRLLTTAMFASLLAKRLVGKIDRECTEWLSLIQSEVQRMNSVVENLLEYSRFSTDRLGIVECECEAVLANVLDGLKADIGANGAQRSPAENLPFCYSGTRGLEVLRPGQWGRN